MSEITPAQQLDLARRNLGSRLNGLSRRCSRFNAAQVLDLGEMLDEFAEDSRADARRRHDAQRAAQ